MAKPKQSDTDVVIEGNGPPSEVHPGWTMEFLQKSSGKWHWLLARRMSDRVITDGRQFTTLGRAITAAVKMFKANETLLAE